MITIAQRTMWSEVRQTPYSINVVKLPCAEVELVSAMESPEQMLTKIVGMYSGRIDTSERNADEISAALKDIKATQLKDPLKMFSTVWLIKGVTRAFTHQLVRYQVGTAFVQESMRFYGAHGEYYVLATHLVSTGRYITSYATAAFHCIEVYNDLIDEGVPSEDARGILPTNILTNTFFFTSVLALKDIYAQRMCCQAQQGEWQPVLKQMRDILTEKYGSDISSLLSAPYERGIPCGYRASFDRPCKWTVENK